VTNITLNIKHKKVILFIISGDFGVNLSKYLTFRRI